MGINNIHHLLFKRLFLLLSLISSNEHLSSGAMSLPTPSSGWPTPHLQLLRAHRVLLNHKRDNSASGWACALSQKYASESSKLWWMTLRERLVYSAKSLARHREYWWAVLDIVVSQGKTTPQDTQAKTNKDVYPYLQTYEYVQLLAKA